MTTELTRKEREDISNILSRRANEIAGFSRDYQNDPKYYGSVELALTREIDRLRRLADKVCPDTEDEFEKI